MKHSIAIIKENEYGIREEILQIRIDEDAYEILKDGGLAEIVSILEEEVA